VERKNSLQNWTNCSPCIYLTNFCRYGRHYTRRIIGGYVHGNEPAHHVAYLYNWAEQPWKTQAQIRHILEMQYKATPDGLGGNDDTGQMSGTF
jgi:putative alpha-1,2-mannosidase